MQLSLCQKLLLKKLAEIFIDLKKVVPLKIIGASAAIIGSQLEQLVPENFEDFSATIEYSVTQQTTVDIPEVVAFDYVIAKLIEDCLKILVPLQDADDALRSTLDSLKQSTLQKLDVVLQSELHVRDKLSPYQQAVIEKLPQLEIVNQFMVGDMQARKQYCYPGVASCLGTRRLGYWKLLDVVSNELQKLKSEETDKTKQLDLLKTIEKIKISMEQEKRRLSFGQAAINAVGHYLRITNVADKDLSIDEVLSETKDQNCFVVLLIKNFIENGSEKEWLDTLIAVLSRIYMDLKKDPIEILDSIINEAADKNTEYPRLMPVVVHALLLHAHISRSETELKLPSNQKSLEDRINEVNEFLSGCYLPVSQQVVASLPSIFEKLNKDYQKKLVVFASKKNGDSNSEPKSKVKYHNVLLLYSYHTLNPTWNKFLQNKIKESTFFSLTEAIIKVLEESKEFYFRVGDLINSYGMGLFELHAELSAQIYEYFYRKDANSIPVQVYKYYGLAYSVLQTDDLEVPGKLYRGAAELKHKEMYLIENKLLEPKQIFVHIQALSSKYHLKLLEPYELYKKTYAEYLSDIGNSFSITRRKAAMHVACVNFITEFNQISQLDKHEVLFLSEDDLSSDSVKGFEAFMQKDVANILVLSEKTQLQSQLLIDIHREWPNGNLVFILGEKEFIPTSVDCTGKIIAAGNLNVPCLEELSVTPRKLDWQVIKKNIVEQLVVNSVKKQAIKAILEIYATQAIYAEFLNMTARALTWNGFSITHWRLVCQFLEVYVNKEEVRFKLKMNREHIDRGTFKKLGSQVAVTGEFVIDLSGTQAKYELVGCNIATIKYIDEKCPVATFRLVPYTFKLLSGRKFEEYDPFYVYSRYMVAFFDSEQFADVGIMDECPELDRCNVEQKYVVNRLQNFYAQKTNFLETAEELLSFVFTKLSESILPIVMRHRYEALGQMVVGGLLFYAQFTLHKIKTNCIQDPIEQLKAIKEVNDIFERSNVFLGVCQSYLVKDEKNLLDSIAQLQLQPDSELDKRTQRLVMQLGSRKYDKNNPQIVSKRFDTFFELIKIKRLLLRKMISNDYGADEEKIRVRLIEYKELIAYFERLNKLLQPSHVALDNIDTVLADVREECMSLQKEIFEFNVYILNIDLLDGKDLAHEFNINSIVVSARDRMRDYNITINNRSRDPRRLLKNLEQELFQMKLPGFAMGKANELKELYLYEELSAPVLPLETRRRYEAFGNVIMRSSLAEAKKILDDTEVLDDPIEQLKAFYKVFVACVDAKKLCDIYRFGVTDDVKSLLGEIRANLLKFKPLVINIINGLEMKLLQNNTRDTLVQLIIAVQWQLQQLLEKNEAKDKDEILALYEKQSKLFDDLYNLLRSTNLTLDAELLSLCVTYNQQAVLGIKMSYVREVSNKLELFVNSCAMFAMNEFSLMAVFAYGTKGNLQLLMNLIFSTNRKGISAIAPLIAASALPAQMLTPMMERARNKFNKMMRNTKGLLERIFNEKEIQQKLSQHSLTTLLANTDEYAHSALISLALTDEKNSLEVAELILAETLQESFFSSEMLKARSAFGKVLRNNGELLKLIMSAPAVIKPLIANTNVASMNIADEDRLISVEAPVLLSGLWGAIEADALTKFLVAQGLVYWLLKFVNIQTTIELLHQLQKSASSAVWFGCPNYREVLINDPNGLAQLLQNYLVQNGKVNQQHYEHLLNLFKDYELAKALLESSWAKQCDSHAMSKSENAITSAYGCIIVLAKKIADLNLKVVSATSTVSPTPAIASRLVQTMPAVVRSSKLVSAVNTIPPTPAITPNPAGLNFTEAQTGRSSGAVSVTPAQVPETLIPVLKK